MRMVRRLYLKEFLALFSVVAVGLSAVVTLMDLIKRADELLPHDPSALKIAQYALLVFPRYFLYTVPVASLLCALYTVGQASKNREIGAVTAAGGRLRVLLAPLAGLGALLSLMTFVVGEFVVPPASLRARALRNEIIDRPSLASDFKEGKLWVRDRSGAIVKIDLYIEETGTFRGMNVFRVEGDRMAEVLQAGEARYDGREGAWVMSGVGRHDLLTHSYSWEAEVRYPHLGPPKVFQEEVAKPYEMGILELRRYILRLEDAGFRNVRLAVEMHSKVSYPLVTLVMTVLGLSFAAKRTLGGLVAAAVGLLLSLLYWLGFTLCLSMGYAGLLPPAAAAWLMPLVFGAAAAALFSRIPE